VERSVDVVHRFARELRPAVLDDLGLIPALHSFVKNFSSETGIPVALSVFAGVEKLSDEKRTVLYRVAHETLTNVSRHACAKRVTVLIEKLPAAARMKISDNGKGFLPKNALCGKRRMRLGLLGIKERVEMVGGRFAIESVPGRGTTVLTEIPFNKRKRKDGRS
jgi:signal transduction histidine kinase